MPENMYYYYKVFILSQCPHCDRVVRDLVTITKQGKLPDLLIVNLEQHPDDMQRYGIRSTPALMLGEFLLEGALSQQEILHWLELYQGNEMVRAYITGMIESRLLHRVSRLLTLNPVYWEDALQMLADETTALQVRLGLTAILEEPDMKPVLQKLSLSLFSSLLEHHSESIRADAAYYLGLREGADAIPVLQALLRDHSSEVREIARESLDTLSVH